jgi:hypothetical protein
MRQPVSFPVVTPFSFEAKVMPRQKSCIARRTLLVCIAAGWVLLLFSGPLDAAESAIEADGPRAPERSLLDVVRRFADAMLVHGVDRWGDEYTGMLISLLNRETLAPFAAMPKAPGGIRAGDRVSLHGANYNTDQNLYQTLYVLSRVTGEAKYAEAADSALADFITRTASPATGLLAWGEHVCWDLARDAWSSGERQPYHEMKREMLFWDKHYASHPEQTEAFARGLWAHQICDQTTGDFSRHARYDVHGPGKGYDFPKEGSYMIHAWSKAYRDTQAPVFLTALNVLGNRYLGKLNERNLMEQDSVRTGRNVSLENLSLATHAHEAADRVPAGELADNLRQLAERIDAGFLALSHDVPLRGFVYFADPATGQPRSYSTSPDGYSLTWGKTYGVDMTSYFGMMCFQRTVQLTDGPTKDAYRKLVLDAADVYLAAKPDLRSTEVWAGEYGAAVFLQLMAYRLAGDAKYLCGARRLAEDAVRLFFDADSPLPKASSSCQHYESITSADTLVYALLAVHLEENGDRTTVDLHRVFY